MREPADLSDKKLQDYFHTARSIIRQAGSSARDKFDSGDFSIYSKEDGEPVSSMDLQVEDMIISGLQDKFPDHGIVSEEAKTINPEYSLRWILDPLDGTANYTRGIPWYTISLACCHQDSLLLGLIYLPQTDTLYHAVRGEGSFRGRERLQVSDTLKLQKSCLAVELIGSEIEAGRNFPGSNIQEKLGGIRAFGCQSLALALTAAGVFDLTCFMRTNFWDIAAGLLLVEEAGGTVTSLEKRESRRGWRTLAAGRRKLLKKFLALLPEKDTEGEKLLG